MRMWAQGIPVFITGTRFAVYAKNEFNLHFEVSMSWHKKEPCQKCDLQHSKNENYFENALNSLTNYCTKREGTKLKNGSYTLGLLHTPLKFGVL